MQLLNCELGYSGTSLAYRVDENTTRYIQDFFLIMRVSLAGQNIDESNKNLLCVDQWPPGLSSMQA